MRVLLIGSGGREHALAWKMAQSPNLDSLLIAPGNAGTAELGENVQVKADDVEGLLALARSRDIDLTVVGPEAPLSDGIVDRFRDAGLAIFGPTRAAARIETSKAFAKDLMQRMGVPAAASETLDSHHLARNAVSDCDLPIVIKADGLAAGKGVIIAETRQQAIAALFDIFEHNRFGDAGAQVLVEEYLEGREVSVFAFVDGQRVSSLVAATDYKRAYDGDLGPNTGGMGSYSPPQNWDREIADKVMRTVFEPVVAGLAEAGSPYTGLLYAGLMVTDDGPKVLEFNCRFGDPETQVVLPRMRSDLLDALAQTAAGDISGLALDWDPRPCVGVVMASGGYPNAYETGKTINGLDAVSPDATVFHAGTQVSEAAVLTSGGRVLSVSALGETVDAARATAYVGIADITFEDAFNRTDIAAGI
jgi:phosphoribosylamine---glycine ligase